MRRYEVVSGAFFTLLALAQLTRLVLRWPVQIAGVPVPLWISGVAFLILGAFALWALRSTRREHQPA